MIQRIQSLYLVVAALTMVVAAVALGRAGAQSEPVVMAGTIIAGVLAVAALVAVFMYTNRLRQRKVVRAVGSGVLLLLVVIAVAAFTGGGFARVMEGEAGELVISAVAALVGLVVSNLAGRAIKKDIDLVKSMDRIR